MLSTALVLDNFVAISVIDDDEDVEIAHVGDLDGFFDQGPFSLTLQVDPLDLVGDHAYLVYFLLFLLHF